ncbi:MAG: methyltransferase, FxLD system [Actinobacteria bacterium]|nr:methyltransferase, FxLD system [Actinomycetota bacterium]
MPPTPWRQYNVEFPDRATAAWTAAHDLHPALTAAQETGALHGWWFVRKQPWKLRYLPDDPDSRVITELLDTLTTQGRVAGWAVGTYEPETRAFGGDAAMDVAHALFHRDSHHILARAAQANGALPWRRETTVLLCSAMLRAAGLDWYEQGDVWSKVAALRPDTPTTTTTGRATALVGSMRQLMATDTRTLCAPGRGPLAGCGSWLDAFESTGYQLAELARHGELTRGLRAVLAHHVIFHANRAALPAADQATLAGLAVDAVFTSTDDPVSPLTATPPPTKVPEMTTVRDDIPAASADQLRHDLTTRLHGMNAIRTPAIEAAFRRTPRHLFLPGLPVEQAYADTPIYTKQDACGASISAASQPWMVAGMLEQLDAQPGERIMEVGAGTGYNAALLAAVVGAPGHVTTIDVDDDLVTAARQHLSAAGVGNVDVVLGDGALGHPEGAPYDRIIATVGAYETPTAWLEQLAPGGRLVVPVRLRGTTSRSIAFERDTHAWVSRGSKLAVFMPLRGIADDARRIVALTPEQDVTLQVNKDHLVDDPALVGVLDTTRHEEWSGVHHPPNVPFEWMELWLCLRLDNPLMRMNTQPSAADRGQVTPMFPWGSMATTRDHDLAYLTIRPAPPASDGGKLYEVGVIGHGPDGSSLAQRVAEEIRTWDGQFRGRGARFEIPDTPTTNDPAAGRFVLDRPHHPITVIWE